jgi:hypothetical protein
MENKGIGGFKTDYVKFIGDLLKDSYGPGFPVLKELIQNANDAGADQLVIEYAEGSVCPKHPLLKRPAITIYNNGKYDKNDSKYIGYISGRSKTDDEKAIGKYGQGMKSIFHLCDMFFIISNYPDDKVNVSEIKGINPWHETEYHKEWNKSFEQEDIEYFSKKLNGRKGMMLWLPLRLDAEKDRIDIDKMNPNEPFGNRNDMLTKLFDVLPMLWASPNGRQLQEIVFKFAGDCFSIKCDDEKKSYNMNEYFKIFNTKVSDKKGEMINEARTIVVKSDKEAQNINNVPEIFEVLSQVKNAKLSTTDTAISITGLASSRPFFDVNYAVFLPLENRIVTKIDTDSGYSYSFLLHGMFDIDSGRKGISGIDKLALTDWEKNIKGQRKAEYHEQAREFWNIFLAQECLFPLLPLAIDYAVKNKIIPQADISGIIKNMHIHHITSSMKNYIFKRHAFSQTFIDNKLEWRLFDSQDDYITLPPLPSGNPLDYFIKPSFIKELDDGNIHIVSNSAISIIDSNHEKNDAILPQLLKSFTDGLFDNDIKMRYFKDIVTHHGKEVSCEDFRQIFEKYKNNADHYKIFTLVFFDNNEQQAIKEIIKRYDDIALIDIEKIAGMKGSSIKVSKSKLLKLMDQNVVYKAAEASDKILELYQFMINSALYSLSRPAAERAGVSDLHDRLPKSDRINILDCLNYKEMPFDLKKILDDNSLKNTFKSLLGLIDSTRKNIFYKLPIHRIKGETDYCSLKLDRDNIYKLVSDTNSMLPKGCNLPENLTLVIDNQDSDIQKKELELLPPLTPFNLIKIFLSDQMKFGDKTQLDWLPNMLDKIESIKEQEDLIQFLKNKEWISIKTDAGKTIFTSQDRVFGEIFTGINLVAQIKTIKNIDVYSTSETRLPEKILNNYLPDKNNQIEFLHTLADELSKKAAFMDLGLNDADILENCAKILCKVGTQYLFRIIEILYQFYAKDIVFNEFYKRLTDSNMKESPENIIQILNILNADRPNEIVIHLFNSLLDNLLSLDNFTIKCFENIKFLSNSLTWQAADNVVCPLTEEDEKNVFEENLLYSTSKDIIAKHKNKLIKYYSKTNDRNDKHAAIIDGNSEIDIYNYFSKILEKGIKKQLVGFLLLILKNNFFRAAKNILNGDEIKKILELFEYSSDELKKHWRINDDFERKIDLFAGNEGFKTNVILQKGHEVDCMTLSGKRKIFKTTGALQAEVRGFLDIRMSEVFESVEEKEIKSIISEVLILGYGQTRVNNEKLFVYLLNKEEMTVELCKEMIFYDIFYIVKFLGLQHIPEIEKNISKLEEYQHREIIEKIKNFLPQKEDLKRQITNLIQNDESIQRKIREKIMKHLSNNQYTVTSIPYELFQNADDALNQRSLYDSSINDDETGFHIITDTDNYLTFSYFGRAINYWPATEITENYSPAWKYDLKNMIMIHGSDKNYDKDTGKFGLGFKSVYFSCDEPVVFSKDTDIYCKIKGGLYPEKMEKPDDIREHETQIVLNLRQDVSVERILSKFRDDAYIQVIFSKQIRKITIDNAIIEWIPRTICESGEYIIETGIIKDGNYLVFHLYFENKKCSLLFLYRNNGNLNYIVPIEKDLPKVWATTPLETEKTIKFIINAPFNVDAGRKIVINDDNDNKLLVKKIGSSLGKALYDDELNKYFDVSSLFTILLSAYSNSAALSEIPRNAIISYQKCAKRLPTGFNSYFSPDSRILYCSQEDFLRCAKILASFFKIKKITNLILITWNFYEFYRKENISSKEINKARHLNSIFEVLNLDEFNKLDKSTLKDFANIINDLDIPIKTKYQFSFKILSRANTWEYVDSVLIPGIKGHENLLLFAPDKRVLGNYSNTSKNFLINYSQSYIPKDDDIYSWLNEFNKNDENVLEKIVLYAKLYNINIEKIKNPSIVGKYEEFDRKLNDQIEYDERSNDNSPNISDIYAWWDKLTPSDKESMAARYYNKLFPNIPEFDISCLMDSKSSKYQSTWFILFILAASMRIGRKTINQDRGFLEFLQSKNWLATMINSDEPDNWMEIFINYMEDPSSEQNYFPWMQQFFVLFIIRRHIDVYIPLFRDIGKLKNLMSMDILLKPRTIVLPQVHGIDAPMMQKIFKIGSSLIVREVLRNSTGNPNEYAVEHAFMPKSSAQKSVFGNADDTRTSSQIYKELKKKFGNNRIFTFGGYYDIPIILYNEEYYDAGLS